MQIPVIMRRYHGSAAIFWAVNIVVIVAIYFVFPALWEAISILYLVLLSLQTAFSNDLDGWLNARVAAKQEESEN